MSDTIEVSKKEYLQFQIGKLETQIEEIDDSIVKMKQKKLDLKDEIRGIRESNRDIFPARGRKKKVQ